MYMGHDHSSPGIENQGQKSRSTLILTQLPPQTYKPDPSAVGLTSIVDRGQWNNDWKFRFIWLPCVSHRLFIVEAEIRLKRTHAV